MKKDSIIKKFIFLDIDGVLNAIDDLYYMHPTRHILKKKKCFPHCACYIGISDSKVKRLKRIVEATDAKIVLISSWKTHYEAYLRRSQYEEPNDLGKYLYNKLRKEGLAIYKTTLQYEKHYGKDRGQGIIKFLNENPCESYIILDDELFDYNEEQLKHLIETDYDKGGLTDQKADEAINLLNRE